MARKTIDLSGNSFRMAPAMRCRSHFSLLIDLAVGLVFGEPFPRTDDFRMDLVLFIRRKDVVGQRFVDRQFDGIALFFQFGVLVSGQLAAFVRRFDLTVELPELGFEVLRIGTLGYEYGGNKAGKK